MTNRSGIKIMSGKTLRVKCKNGHTAGTVWFSSLHDLVIVHGSDFSEDRVHSSDLPRTLTFQCARCGHAGIQVSGQKLLARMAELSPYFAGVFDY